MLFCSDNLEVHSEVISAPADRADWSLSAPHPFQTGSLLIQSGSLGQTQVLDERNRKIHAPSLHNSENLRKNLEKPAAPFSDAHDSTQIEDQELHGSNTITTNIDAMALPTSEIVHLRLTKHDKSRRLCWPSARQSLFHISMHGYIDKINLLPSR